MATDKKDAAFLFASNVVKTRYEQMTRETVEVTKKSILDTLGTIVAASGAAQGCKQLVELVKEAGGKPESTIMAFGGKVPSFMAAFANGAMAHGLDYDDLHPTAYAHPSITTVPAAFAVAERVGNVDGKRFIAAVALGNDMLCRLGVAVSGKPHWRPEKWSSSAAMGAFSAAAAAGRLLGFTESKMVSAFGIALTQASGAREMIFGVESELRGMYAAFPNKSGVLSALMAEKGINGPRNSLEGTGGFFKVYYDGQYDRDKLIADLGKRFEGAIVGFKPWPACGNTHAYIDATLRIVQQHDIRPEDVERVVVSVDEGANTLCQPLEFRRKPPTNMDAKYSIPFTLGVALARRNVVIADYLPDSIKDPMVLQLAQKVSPRLDPKIVHHEGVVEITVKDGKTYSQRVTEPYGQPGNPIAPERLKDKFRDCASYSAKPLSRQRVEDIISMVTNLEELKDVGEIARFLG